MACNANTRDVIFYSLLIVHAIVSIIAGFVWTSYDYCNGCVFSCDQCDIGIWFVYALICAVIIFVLVPTFILLAFHLFYLFITIVFGIYMCCCDMYRVYSECCCGSNDEEKIPLV